MTNGYPAGTALGIGNMLQPGTVVAGTPGRYTGVVINATTIQYQLNGATNPANCWVQYAGAATINTPPTILTDIQANLNAGC
jgi:hypothetical protein